MTALLVAASICSWAPAARADGKEACRQAYEEGQVARAAGRLRGALTGFRACSQPACASFMRTDCARWIDEVSADLPTLVMVVRDEAGRDLAGAQLLVDGEARPEIAAGTALPVDPGAHELRLAAPGMLTTSQRLVVRVGEHERRVEIVLRPSAPPAPPAPPLNAERHEGAATWPYYALGGLAVAGLGVFTGFAVSGRSIEENRSASCAPSCTDAQVSPVHTDYRIADAGLGVALGAAAIGLVYYLVSPKRASRSAGALPLVFRF